MYCELYNWLVILTCLSKSGIVQHLMTEQQNQNQGNGGKIYLDYIKQGLVWRV